MLRSAQLAKRSRPGVRSLGSPRPAATGSKGRTAGRRTLGTLADDLRSWQRLRLVSPQVRLRRPADAVPGWLFGGDETRQSGRRNTGQRMEPAAGGLRRAEHLIPKLAASTAGTTVIWQSEESEEKWIEAASRAGGEWAEPVELSGPESFSPQIGVDAAGTAVAIWTSSYGEEGEYVESSSLPVGGHWSEPTLISGPVAERSARLAVASNGQTLAAWPAPDPFLEGPVVEGALGLDGEWEEPTTLSATGAWAVRPAVALDGQGDGAVAWWAGNPTLPQATEFVTPQPDGTSGGSEPAPSNSPSSGSRRRRATVARIALVRKSKAYLKLHCPGALTCKGDLRLLPDPPGQKASRPAFRPAPSISPSRPAAKRPSRSGSTERAGALSRRLGKRGSVSGSVATRSNDAASCSGSQPVSRSYVRPESTAAVGGEDCV